MEHLCDIADMEAGIFRKLFRQTGMPADGRGPRDMLA